MNNNVPSIELFSGAGGLALGLEESGFHHVALVERDKNATATLRLNLEPKQNRDSLWNLVSGDVREIRYDALSNAQVRLVAGGPPCQPFSLGGKHAGPKDRRDLFPEAVRAVRETRPQAFVFENVKGLLRTSFSTYFNYILLQLTFPDVVRADSESVEAHLERLERMQTSGRGGGLSYNVVFRLLNAADYGVPQTRYRVFIVGFRDDLELEWSFPETTNSLDALLWSQWVDGSYWDEHRIPKRLIPEIPKRYRKRIDRLRHDYVLTGIPGNRWRTVRDALVGLPDPRDRQASDIITNHELRLGAKEYPGHTGSLMDEPSKTLKAGAHGVPGGENMVRLDDGTLRYFTVRESARIQTFPDDYYFAGSWTEAMRQIGNAVPVELARKVGKSILNQLGTTNGEELRSIQSTA
ncbi:MAG TPA: DNA cytosine methyltransferase [Sediminispirochaeta sp.]|nr:DNA cytosine methyltransferase [Sediminispirochaeta sp.]